MPRDSSGNYKLPKYADQRGRIFKNWDAIEEMALELGPSVFASDAAVMLGGNAWAARQAMRSAWTDMTFAKNYQFHIQVVGEPFSMGEEYATDIHNRQVALYIKVVRQQAAYKRRRDRMALDIIMPLVLIGVGCFLAGLGATVMWAISTVIDHALLH